MAYQKPNSEFLYDDATGQIVGVKNSDGTESFFGMQRTPGGPLQANSKGQWSDLGDSFSEQLITDFSDAALWKSSSAGVPVLSVEYDAKYSRRMKLATDGTTNNHDIVLPVDLDLSTGDTLMFPFDFDSGITLLNVAVSFNDTSFTKNATLLDASLNATGGGSRPDFTPNSWNGITVSRHTLVGFGGGAVAADFGKVRAIRIRVKTTAATSATCRFGTMRLLKSTDGPKIIWHFDDGRINTYTNAYPILKQYGYKATLAVMPDSIGGTYSTPGGPVAIMTAAQLAEVYSDGWEFVGHHENSFSGQTYAQRQTMINTFKNWARSNSYLRGINHWTLVGGWFDLDALKQLSTQFISCRRVAGPMKGFVAKGSTELLPLSTQYINNAYTLAAAKAQVDTLVAAKNGVLIFTFHNILPTLGTEVEDWTTADFQALVEYAASKGVKGASYSEVFGN